MAKKKSSLKLVSYDPLVYQKPNGKYYLKKFGLLWECFKSGYIKDSAQIKGFSVTYGKVFRNLTDEEKIEADRILFSSYHPE